MHVRDERQGDAARISDIHYAAFMNHPAHPPGAQPVEHLIVQRLRADNALTLSLLAETGGQAVGHVALSPCTVGPEREGWFLLGPVGVLPPYQGRGLGSALVRQALSRLSEAGARGVVLVGDPGFYLRLGFERVEGLVYPGVPDHYVLAARLNGVAPRGDIIGHEAFAHPGD